MLRTLIVTSLFVLAVPACDGATASGADSDSSVNDVTSPYEADNFIADDTAIADEDVPEPVYPGNPCDDDEQCSTGLCWGTVTAKGHFQDKVCQLRCVAVDDFTRYCDSDVDCCTGHCCLGCGPREGLCVKD